MADLRLVVQREPSQEDCMLGELFLDDQPFCYTLEDEQRAVKVHGETAIPAGAYDITLRPLGESRMDPSYTSRYPFYKGQLWLQNVPGFTYVYIHTGNNDDHTEGCILVGDTKYADTIGSSRDAYRRLYPVILQAIEHGQRVTIEIRDA